MKKLLIIPILFFAVFTYSQPRVLIGLKGEKILDTVVSLNVQSPLTLVNDTTIGITGSALTKTDDTNVTLTLGGSPSVALLAASSLTLGWTGLLSVARGGTGTASPGLVAGTNITSITGTWPNQTINASGGGSSGWALTGNAGTVDGTNFIGTTDAVPVSGRFNNILSFRFDSLGATSGNARIGFKAGGSTSIASVAFGFKALASASGGVGGNTAVGNESLTSNTTGLRNTAVGISALKSTSGSADNDYTAIGAYSLTSAANGSTSTGVGAYSLFSTSYGVGNTGFGKDALYSITANSNTNVGIGTTAGRYYTGSVALTSANSSIFIGSSSMAKTNGSTNEIVIGTSAIGNGNNTSTIGTTATTDFVALGKGHFSQGSSTPTLDTTAILEGTSTTKGFLPPRMTTTQKLSITSGVQNTTRAGGTGYTNGTYTANALTGGTGTGATATLTISGGVVTVATMVNRGVNYVVGDVLTGSSIGPGSGFTLTITSLSAATGGLTVYDVTLNQMSYWNTTTWVNF